MLSIAAKLAELGEVVAAAAQEGDQSVFKGALRAMAEVEKVMEQAAHRVASVGTHREERHKLLEQKLQESDAAMANVAPGDPAGDKGDTARARCYLSDWLQSDVLCKGVARIGAGTDACFGSTLFLCK